MSREFKPGDVARIEYGGFDDIAVRIDPKDWAVPAGTVRDANVTDVRPLVVIDPEDREAVERLARALPLHWNLEQPDDPDLFTESVNEIADALREYANPKPPKPDEPQGLGAVVEDAKGDAWVLINVAGEEIKPVRQWRTWWGNRPWADIAAVGVLSPGVEVDQ